MPLYEYRCRSCGARFERLVRGGAATADANGSQPAIACPQCDSAEVKRLLSAFARTAPACDPLPSGGG